MTVALFMMLLLAWVILLYSDPTYPVSYASGLIRVKCVGQLAKSAMTHQACDQWRVHVTEFRRAVDRSFGSIGYNLPCIRGHSVAVVLAPDGQWLL